MRSGFDERRRVARESKNGGSTFDSIEKFFEPRGYLFVLWVKDKRLKKWVKS